MTYRDWRIIPNFVPKIDPIIGRMGRMPFCKRKNDVENGYDEGEDSDVFMRGDNRGLHGMK